MIPFYEEHDIPLQRVLTERGTEYCGTHDRHEYELYLAVENIDHTRTKAKSPQTNGIVERFHKTMLDEFYRIAFRKKLYETIEDLQSDSTSGCASSTRPGPIRASGASERPPCRPSLTRSRTPLPASACHCLRYLLPDAPLAPARKPIVDRLVRAVVGRTRQRPTEG